MYINYSITGVTDLKPGSATKPFFGIKPIMLDNNGNEIYGKGAGVLAFKGLSPGQARSLFNNHSRFKETYFNSYPGYYFSGDFVFLQYLLPILLCR